MNQDNDNRFVNSNNIEEQTSNQELDSFSDDSYNDVVANSKRQRYNALNHNNAAEPGKNYRKNSYTHDRFMNNSMASNNDKEEENNSSDQDNQNETGEKKSESSNPLKNLNPLKKDKKDDKNLDQSTQDFVKGTKNFIKIFIKLKVIIFIGAIVALVVFLMVLLATIFDTDIDSPDNTEDASTGVVLRTEPAQSYKCTTSSTTNQTGNTADMNLGIPTSFTKDEFIEKVKNYKVGSSARCSQAQVQAAHNKLVEKAGYIYDIGKQLGINPEIIFLRAQAEGYSPSCMPSLASYNNFYGMGCGNGRPLSTCTNFGTVEAGVYNAQNPSSSAFFNWIVRNTTESKNYSYVFGIYAWLHSEWSLADGPTFSKNGVSGCKNWGLGSCCYSRLVEKHLDSMGRADRSKQIKEACEDGKGPIKTLIDLPASNFRKNWFEESNLDQRAYALYQTENIINIRKSIFGVGADNKQATPQVCENKQISIDISGSINDTSDTSLKGTSIADKLASNGTNIDAVNAQMLDTIMKSTPGTRTAVVNAGKFLLNTFAAYNTKVPYMFSGGNKDVIGNNGKYVAKANMSYYGINPYFGATLKDPVVRSDSLIYYHSGLDCSGFVHWALHNGGLDIPYLDTKTYINEAGKYHITLKGVDEARNQNSIQIGDVLVKNDGGKNHHAALIVDFDNESITVLEEVGNGLQARKRVYSNSKDMEYLSIFKVADMSYWYDNASHSDSFRQKFNNGLIKVD